MRRISLVFLCIFLVSCSPKPVEPELEETIIKIPLRQNYEYPEFHKRYELPEYPDARIKKVSAPVESLADGVKINLVTSDLPADAGQFYADFFAEKEGWTFHPPRFPSERLHGAVARKPDENLHYEIIIHRPTGAQESSIEIMFFEREGELMLDSDTSSQ